MNTERLDALIARLEAVAEKNKDDFGYRLTIEPTRRGMRYHFEAYEAADNHVIVSGSGYSLDEALDSTEKYFQAGLDSWGYKE